MIHTTRSDGGTHERVLARLQDGDGLYVAVNHWPRAWYRQALDNPNVQVTLAGETGDYLAVPVSDAEHERLEERFPIGFGGRLQMGFPPRHFLRLEPVERPDGIVRIRTLAVSSWTAPPVCSSLPAPSY